MRRVLSFPQVFVLVAAAFWGLTASTPLPGEEGMPRGGERRRFSSPVQFPFLLEPGPMIDRAAVYPAYPGYAYPGYFGTPWFIPQTQRNRYPVPQYEEPKLGLQYQYPYAYQFGIQVPPETDEPIFPPAFVERRGGYLRPSVAEGIALMKKGQYAEAGRRFARELRDEAAPPELYLLISEALWAVEKEKDADIVLRQAIDVSQSLDFLDRADLAGKFASREDLQKKLENLSDSLTPNLLHGTILILAGKKEEGLNYLRFDADKDQASRRVYLHFVGAAFGHEEEKKPEGKKGQEKKAPPKEKPAEKKTL